MFTLVKKQTRTTTDVLFYFEIDPSKKTDGTYIKDQYITTGKIVSGTKQFSEDRLTVVTTIIFRSYDDWKEFIADKFCEKHVLVPNTIYDIENEITSDLKYYWD